MFVCFLTNRQVFPSLDGQDNHITIRADTERRAPKREAARYIDVRVCPFAIAMTLFVHVVHQEIHGPYLSAMSVSAELDVDAEVVFLRYFVWLMVDEEGGFGGVGLLYQLCDVAYRMEKNSVSNRIRRYVDVISTRLHDLNRS